MWLQKMGDSERKVGADCCSQSLVTLSEANVIDHTNFGFRLKSEQEDRVLQWTNREEVPFCRDLRPAGRHSAIVRSAKVFAAVVVEIAVSRSWPSMAACNWLILSKG